jgi:pentapeptide MXKDX repeat protein
MRKLIIATAALALVSSTALAQSSDKGAAPAASDSMSKGDMSKGDMSKDTMSKSKKKAKSSAKKTGDDAMTKQ